MRNQGNNIVGSGLLLKAAFLLMLFSVSGLEAQSVPADLLDLGIEELFKAEVSDHSAPVTNPSWGRAGRSGSGFQISFVQFKPIF